MRSILAGSSTSSAKLWRSRSKTDGTNNFNFSHRSRFFNYECNNSYNNCIFYLRLYLHFSIYLYSTLSQNSKPWFAPILFDNCIIQNGQILAAQRMPKCSSILFTRFEIKPVPSVQTPILFVQCLTVRYLSIAGQYNFPYT